MSWIRERSGRFDLPHFHPAQAIGSTPRVGHGEYHDNLVAIVSLARRYGATPIIAASPINPYRLLTVADRDFHRWKPWLESALSQVKASPGEALRHNPGNFYPLWMKGYVLTRLGFLENGRELLRKALEGYDPSDRAKPSYVEAALAAAERMNVRAVDPNAVLREAANDVSEESFYLDRCHMTPEGHRLVARRLSEIILDAARSRSRLHYQRPTFS